MVIDRRAEVAVANAMSTGHGPEPGALDSLKSRLGPTMRFYPDKLGAFHGLSCEPPRQREFRGRQGRRLGAEARFHRSGVSYTP
jgi:hypothetical protein